MSDPTAPRDMRARFVLRIEGPRIRGWVQLEAQSRVLARAEAAQAFRGLRVTLYECDTGPGAWGYVRVGVVTQPASATVVEVSGS